MIVARTANSLERSSSAPTAPSLYQQCTKTLSVEHSNVIALPQYQIPFYQQCTKSVTPSFYQKVSQKVLSLFVLTNSVFY